MKKINIMAISILLVFFITLTASGYGVEAAKITDTRSNIMNTQLAASSVEENKLSGFFNGKETLNKQELFNTEDEDEINEDENQEDENEDANNQYEVILEDQLNTITEDTYDKFLKLDGIQGESADLKHKNEIDILTYAFGGRNLLEDNEPSQNLHLNVIKLVKNIDKSSPKLFQAMLNGDKINNGTIYMVKSGRSASTISTIVLKDVTVTSYKQYGKYEEVCLGYSKISFTYFQQNADGTQGASETASWNLNTNSAK